MTDPTPEIPGVPQGVRLRRRILSTEAAALDFEPDAQFPDIWGVVVDYSVGEAIVTVVGLRDGTASLYTDGSFGIVGGHRHAPVREAAVECVEVVGQIWSQISEYFSTVEDMAYPEEGEMHFYLLGYDGAYRAAVSEDEVYARTHFLTPIFAYTQGIVTQLRLASEDDSSGGEPN